MGISRAALKVLIKVTKNRPFVGKAITFGKQGVEATYEDVIKFLQDDQYRISNLEEKDILTDPDTQFGDTIHQSTLHMLMGCDQAESIDYFPDEKPDHIIDLNKKIPTDFIGKYDSLFDFGTTEHCFNVPQVLENAVKLLKVGGQLQHCIPMSKDINHSFYQFSPTFFFDYYSLNGFENCNLYILYVKFSIFGKKKYYFFEYTGQIDQKNLLHNFKYFCYGFFIAQKTKQTEIQLPIQNYYRRVFQNKDSQEGENSEVSVSKYQKLIPAFLKPFAYNLYRKYQVYKMLQNAERLF